MKTAQFVCGCIMVFSLGLLVGSNHPSEQNKLLGDVGIFVGIATGAILEVVERRRQKKVSKSQ